jgi:hypothetical protein
MPVIEVDIKDNESSEYWCDQVTRALEDRVCFLNERNGLHTEFIVTARQNKRSAEQQTDNSGYTKCADEVLKVINYSSDSVHGRKIIEIIKRHFA